MWVYVYYDDDHGKLGQGHDLKMQIFTIGFIWVTDESLVCDLELDSVIRP